MLPAAFIYTHPCKKIKTAKINQIRRLCEKYHFLTPKSNFSLLMRGLYAKNQNQTTRQISDIKNFVADTIEKFSDGVCDVVGTY